MSITIILAEDDPNLRNIIQVVLEEEGYRVTAASNGEEALTNLSLVKEGEIPLLLLDLSMPLCSGEQVLEKLSRTLLFPSRIVLMSAEPGRLRRVGQRWGIGSTLSKPFTIDSLLSTVEKASSAVPISAEVASISLN